MPRETTTYTVDGGVIAGQTVTRSNAPLGADTYYTGMLLEYDADNDVYIALATDANCAAVYNGDDERVLAAAGYGAVILWGEVSEEKLVDASGDALTLTEDQKATYAANGIFVKEN